MADLDACTLLREADRAWFELNTGGGVRAVTDQNGERIEYSSANRAGLLAMIQTLQPQCTTYQALALGSVSPKPIQYFF